MSNIVQYWVMKRPKHAITGEVILGKLRGAVRNPDMTVKAEGATLWFPGKEDLLQPNDSHMSVSAPMTDALSGKVDGEPWLLHSVHYSIEEAVKAAKPVASSVGSENVRILKSLAHEITIKLV